MMTQSKGGIAAIIDTATRAATESREANFIHIKMKPDRSALILTTVIAGNPRAWITYDKDQLDELMRMLQSIGADLK